MVAGIVYRSKAEVILEVLGNAAFDPRWTLLFVVLASYAFLRISLTSKLNIPAETSIVHIRPIA